MLRKGPPFHGSRMESMEIKQFRMPATTQNLVVKFDGETCGGVLVENASVMEANLQNNGTNNFLYKILGY